MLEISIQSLEKSYNVTKVLENITFDVQTGERIGIIGRNGTGKTTLFKILMGKEPYNGGLITFRKNMKLGYLDQIPEYAPDITVRDVIRLALSEIVAIQNQMRNLEKDMSCLQGQPLEQAISKYGKLTMTFESFGGYARFVDEQKLIEGFSLTEEFLNRSFSLLSGGEKTKVMLAQLILSNPDVLLLDEPSNHLDTSSLEWLEQYLMKYRGAVVAISHDRYFLDHVANKIIEFEDQISHVYYGNYAYYKTEKEVRLTLQLKAFGNQQKQLKAMEEAVERFRAWSCGGHNIPMVKKMKNMQKRIERVEKLDRPITHRKQMQVAFGAKDRSGNDVLKIEKLSHGYDEEFLFEKVNLMLKYRDVFALVGPNGCGKSTLIKIITGEISPKEGQFIFGSRVKLAYLDQNVVLDDENLTVLELYRSHYPCKEGIARSVLAKSLFMGEDIFKKVSMLSGGERMRLKLCILMQEEVNFLILDEPTNHLDIESREMLETTLARFEGTILFVSHDRYFVRKLATRIGEFHSKKIRVYEGDYDYYQEKRLVSPNVKLAERVKRKSQITLEKNAIETKKQNQIEERYQLLEREIKSIEQKMNECLSDYENLTLLTQERDLIESEMMSILEKIY